MKTLAAAVLIVLTSFLGANSAGAQTVINNICELQAINNNLSGDYVLGQDIDATDFSCNGGVSFPFIPIQGPFNGTLDGQAYSIRGLTIHDPTGPFGLFQSIGPNGIVRNLILQNMDMTGAYNNNYYVGGVAAYNSGTIRNVSVSGSISSPRVGALVGYNDDGVIEYSYASTSVAAIDCGEGGGLVADNDGLVLASSADGSVSGENTSSGCMANLGGLAGSLVGGVIAASYAAGTVTGENADAGGLVGEITGGTVERSYATGVVSGSGNSWNLVGGFAGSIDGGAVRRSYAMGAAGSNVVATSCCATNAVGGFAGWAGGASISQTYSAGRVSGSVSGSGENYVGGFLGAAILANGKSLSGDYSYWNTETSERPTATGYGSFAGVTGKTTEQLQSALPNGFDASVWSITLTQTYPYLALPIGQLNASSYDRTTGAYSDEVDTCAAAVYAMIARTVGEIDNDPALLRTPIDYFWTSTGASWGKNYTAGATLWSSVAFIGVDGQVPVPGQPLYAMAPSLFSAIEGEKISQWLTPGNLAIVAVSTTVKGRPPSATEAHYVLATGSKGGFIFADDPWSGTKVGIDLNPNDRAYDGHPTYGHVTLIMNPVDGNYYSAYDLAFNPGALPPGIVQDFKETTSTEIINGVTHYAYDDLPAFNAVAPRNTGWIEVQLTQTSETAGGGGFGEF